MRRPPYPLSRPPGLRSSGPLLALGTALALGASALIVRRNTQHAEQTHRPRGSFIETPRGHQHWVAKGNGPPVVLLHGNGGMMDDMLISGVPDLLARTYRTIIFDRPGFGYSERPRGFRWDALAQGRLAGECIAQLGVDRAVLVGHSWGCLTALAMALEMPERVAGLVLVSGYFFPSGRFDAVMQAPAAMPLVGDILNRTILPLLGEALSPLQIRHMFSPQAPTRRFKQEFPLQMALRPEQLRAYAQDASHMPQAARTLSVRYDEIRCPVTIIAGAQDRIVDVRQSERLARAIPHSTLDILEGHGHMLHHFDPARAATAVNAIASARRHNGHWRESAQG